MIAIARERQGDTELVRVTAPVVVGVIADTHIPMRARALPVAARAALEGTDLIVHAGDLVTMPVLSALRAIAPVIAVYGNNDPWAIQRVLPRLAIIAVDDWRIGLVHGHEGVGDTRRSARRSFTDVHAVIFGHSHQPYNDLDDGVLMFNPGSATDRRRALTCSCGRLTVTVAGITGTIVPV